MELVKVFTVSDKIPGFSKTELFLSFCMGLIKSVHKKPFYFNHAIHLKILTNFEEIAQVMITIMCKATIENWRVANDWGTVETAKLSRNERK